MSSIVIELMKSTAHLAPKSAGQPLPVASLRQQASVFSLLTLFFVSFAPDIFLVRTSAEDFFFLDGKMLQETVYR